MSQHEHAGGSWTQRTAASQPPNATQEVGEGERQLLVLHLHLRFSSSVFKQQCRRAKKEEKNPKQVS